MKKYLLLLAVSALYISCSDNDDNAASTPLSLLKTETFTPSKAIYDDPGQVGNIQRNVKYYQGNTIVADSTFNSNGVLHAWTVRTSAANSLTVANFVQGAGEVTRYIFDFDFQGNVIHEKRINYPSQKTEEGYYTYSGNTITYNQEVNEDFPEPFQITYTRNAAGLIESMTGYNVTSSLQLQNDKVLSEAVFNNVTQTQEYMVNNSYYTVSVPSAALKTVAALNSAVIMNRNVASLSVQGNHYIKDHGILHYDKEFNSLDYITRDKCFNTDFTSTDPLEQDPQGYETFYYYQ